MQYQHMGRIEGRLSIPRKPVFAVIELGATQYKVPSYFLVKPLLQACLDSYHLQAVRDCSLVVSAGQTALHCQR